VTTTATVYKYVTLRHGRTRYIEAGTGHPLILLHISSIEGGADDSLPVLDLLSSRFRVLAPDLLGWPPSDTMDGIDAFPFLVDFLRDFQDALGIKSSHICGVSMGGWIAGLFAYESPDRCDKVVVGGHPFTGSPNLTMLNYTLDSITPDEKVHAWVEGVAKGQGGVDAETLAKEKVTKIHEPGFGEAFVKLMRSMGDPVNREHYALIHRLPRMRLPLLILIGERDAPAMKLKDEVAAAAPTAEVRKIASGHRMHLEDPELFASAVRDYLSA